ncbi:flavodoxin domain-containing protein [Paraglaciecola aquimarina]|uniref:Flavodoxin domain-containing protein n=1 Tax=Paraglaciecola aquimarina TaxID=1235557 RepID=A0ABU3STM1_9ALTE|nr:flavodoxin domain-containing protein [Paraglaciecola aquimarina]MDU0353350.1 flavodoxin domain-containing protein [Paraglaciecola aquimarina]
MAFLQFDSWCWRPTRQLTTFFRQFDKQPIKPKYFTVVGLGDSSYDTFCFAAKHIEQQLTIAGSELIEPCLHIDVLNHPIPEDVAVEWLQSWINQ